MIRKNSMPNTIALNRSALRPSVVSMPSRLLKAAEIRFEIPKGRKNRRAVRASFSRLEISGSFSTMEEIAPQKPSERIKGGYEPLAYGANAKEGHKRRRELQAGQQLRGRTKQITPRSLGISMCPNVLTRRHAIVWMKPHGPNGIVLWVSAQVLSPVAGCRGSSGIHPHLRLSSSLMFFPLWVGIMAWLAQRLKGPS